MNEERYTMRDLRRLAAAWRRRNQQLLAESLEGEQP